MNDKIKVPHEYLPVLRALRNDASCDAVSTDEVLDALIAAAEADQPPLPKGWVAFYDLGRLAFRHLWHNGRGNLYTHDQPVAQFLVGKVGDDHYPRDLLTPLRPIATEADVEKAAQAARVQFHAGDGRTACIVDWDRVDGQVQEEWLAIARAAFEAAGIEVKN